MQPINLIIKGIKCDNPNCDFRDESVGFEVYEKYLNKPCPKTSGNARSGHYPAQQDDARI